MLSDAPLARTRCAIAPYYVASQLTSVVSEPPNNALNHDLLLIRSTLWLRNQISFPSIGQKSEISVPSILPM
jgi:hypothetical protein